MTGIHHREMAEGFAGSFFGEASVNIGRAYMAKVAVFELHGVAVEPWCYVLVAYILPIVKGLSELSIHF